MKRLPLLLIITTLVFIAGCSDSACYKRLIEVDSLTENDLIDSACLVINDIEKNYHIKEGKEKAYYNLLKYQLHFRNKEKNISNSIIDYCITYYSKHEDARKLALSYYLKARMNKDKDAITYLKYAEFISQKTNDNFLKMRLLNSLADINIRYEDYETALKYSLKSIEYGEKADDLETLIWCYICASNIYSNLGKKDTYRSYAQKCLAYSNYATEQQKLYIYMNISVALEDTDTAKSREYALKSLEIAPTNNAYQILAKQARKRKDYALSEEYLTEALKYSPSVDWEAFITHELAQTKELLGKHKEANLLEKRVIKLRDSVELIHAQDSIKEKQVAAELEHQRETEIEEKENYIAAITINLTTIIIITIAAYIIRRKKHKKSIDDINAMNENIENMNKDMDSMAKDMNIMEKKMTDAEKQIDKYKNKIEKMATINKAKEKELKATTREMQKQLAMQKKDAEKRIQKETLMYKQGCDIYNKVKNGHEKVVLSDEDMSSLITFYMSDNPEFKEKTERTYSNLTEYQCAIIILKDMGLNYKQIANAMKTTDSAIRTAASRNKKR